MNIFFALSMLLSGIACVDPDTPVTPPDTKPDAELVSFKWDFNDSEGWVYSHQDTAPDPQWALSGGNLVLSTRGGTRDRSKMSTLRDDFIDGTYTWRFNVPNIAPGDQVSIAGFIYQDDHHEVDFEIGYGSKAVRDEYGIKPGELVACMTNQDFPVSSTYTAITPGWHVFSIKMEIVNGFYVIRWIIDGNECKKIDVDYDEEDARFRVFCSVENLLFMGDNPTTKDYSARFDYVSFEGHLAGTYKDNGPAEAKSFAVSGLRGASDGQSIALWDADMMREFTLGDKCSTIAGKAVNCDKYVALYPFNPNATLKGSIVSTSVSEETPAYARLEDVPSLSVGASSSDSGAIDFKQGVAYASFTLGEGFGDAAYITFESSSSLPLCGDVFLDTSSKSPKAVCPSGGAKLTVRPADGLLKQGEKYYFPIIPGVYQNGFSLVVEQSGARLEVPLKGDFSFTAGSVTDLGNIRNVAEWTVTRWDFEKDIDGWYYYTHSSGPSRQYYEIIDGCVKIWTLAGTLDRNKLHTYRKDFGEGEYEFRVYVNKVAPGEKVSTGCFIYADDTHELDFEIGYGSSGARRGCGATADQMVACMTNQGNPFNSTYTPISVGWHTCTLKMEVVNSRYVASWWIDGTKVKTLNLNFGPDVKFLISVSVENLEFMGEKTPEHDNYALFDYVAYKQKNY